MDPALRITLVLIAVNWFFVAAEFALVKTRSAQIEIALKQQTAWSKSAKLLIDKMDTYLAACQLGITLASLLIGWLGEKTMTRYLLAALDYLQISLPEQLLHTISIVIWFTIITWFHIVLGEQLPKIIGITYPLKTTLLIAKPLRVFNILFGPFIKLLNRLSNSCSRLFWLKPLNEEESHSEEEIRMIISESEEDGKINLNERELIQNVFDFDNNVIRKIMTPVNQMVCIDINESLDTSFKQIIDQWYSRIPVFEGTINNIVWIVYAKDILKSIYYQEQKPMSFFLKPIQFVPEYTLVMDLLHTFQAKKSHIAIVIDEFGNVLGLVTLEDILEELVGNIEDEHDDEIVWPVVKIKEWVWTVVAHTSIEEANELLPAPFPVSDYYDTVSGYINLIFHGIPQVGDRVDTDYYTITILQSKRQTTELIQIELLSVK